MIVLCRYGGRLPGPTGHEQSKPVKTEGTDGYRARSMATAARRLGRAALAASEPDVRLLRGSGAADVSVAALSVGMPAENLPPWFLIPGLVSSVARLASVPLMRPRKG